jgi:hypothetical protein
MAAGTSANPANVVARFERNRSLISVASICSSIPMTSETRVCGWRFFAVFEVFVVHSYFYRQDIKDHEGHAKQREQPLDSRRTMAVES